MHRLAVVLRDVRDANLENLALVSVEPQTPLHEACVTLADGERLLLAGLLVDLLLGILVRDDEYLRNALEVLPPSFLPLARAAAVARRAASDELLDREDVFLAFDDDDVLPGFAGIEDLRQMEGHTLDSGRFHAPRPSVLALRIRMHLDERLLPVGHDAPLDAEDRLAVRVLVIVLRDLFAVVALLLRRLEARQHLAALVGRRLRLL